MSALEGVRVVELGLWVAGPAAGGIMADWGAEVIKIEALSGDPMRTLYRALSGSKEARCPPFDLHNRGKRSVAVDLKADEGPGLAETIIASADVLLTNMRPSFMERVGLDHRTLLERHPRLVYASLTGYGMEGPDADAPGYDVAAFGARAGVVDRCTPPGEQPTYPPPGMGDSITAIATVAAVLAGLRHRDRTGEGQLVATSLLRTGVYCLGMEVAAKLALDKLAPPAQRTKPTNPLLNPYQAGDGRWFWLMGAESDRHWPRLMETLETPQIGEDERFQSPRDRRRNGEALVAALDEVFARQSRDEWARRFEAGEVWWAPVNSVEDLLEDPQAAAAGTFVEGLAREDGSRERALATPVEFDHGEIDGTRPAPEIGADTAAVLADLGLDDDEVRRLHEQGVIGGTEPAPSCEPR